MGSTIKQQKKLLATTPENPTLGIHLCRRIKQKQAKKVSKEKRQGKEN